MANFKIAEQFVAHLRLHRRHIAVNHGQLAKSFNCSTSSLRVWIERLLEAKIINRSPNPGPDGVDYWLTDDTMLVPDWLDKLGLVLKMSMAKNPRFNVGQKFGVLNEFLREMRSGLEQELANRDQKIKELEDERAVLKGEVDSMRFEMNAMLQKMQELEAAHNSMVATVNFREQKAVAEANAAEAGK